MYMHIHTHVHMHAHVDTHTHNTHKCTHTHAPPLTSYTRWSRYTPAASIQAHCRIASSQHTPPWLHSKEAESPGAGMEFKVKLFTNEEALPLLGNCRGPDSTVVWSRKKEDSNLWHFQLQTTCALF